jgi:hypothetical protein
MQEEIPHLWPGETGQLCQDIRRKLQGDENPRGLVRPKNKDGPTDKADSDQNPRRRVPPFRFGYRPQIVGACAVAHKGIDDKTASRLKKVVEIHRFEEVALSID